MDSLREKLNSLESRLRAAKAIQVLKASAGWQEFLREVKAHEARHLRRVLDHGEQNRDYVAGFCSGLTYWTDLMDDVDAEIPRIEDQLKRLSNRDVEKDPIGGIR